MMRRILEVDGYEVAVAPDGDSSLEILRRDGVDLLILDVMMPGLDGVEVCRRLDHQSTKVLMLTALGDVSTEMESLRAGARGYLTKPFSSMELLDRVEELLKQ
jgi:DNA-binding response OmpR family regulator